MLIEQAAEAGVGVFDAEFIQTGPDGRLIAVDHRFAQIVLKVSDGFDHAGIGAAQKVAVGVAAQILIHHFLPFLRRDR